MPPRWSFSLLFGACLALSVRAAHAQATSEALDANATAEAPPGATSFEKLEVEDESPAHEKKKKAKGHRLDFKGRIIGRAQLTSRRVELLGADLAARDRRLQSLDLSLPSARFGFHYHSHIPGVTAVASLELMDKPKLKDGYVQAKTNDGRLGLRVGQFKLPGSPFETASRLSLPSAGRGFIHDILTDRLEIGGRRPGLAGFGKIRLRPPWVLELTLGVFQGSYLRDEGTRDRSLLALQALGAQTVVGRIEAAIGFAELGITGNYRVGTRDLLQPGEEPSHFWSGGVDASVDVWLGPGGLRIWTDFNLGESWFVAENRKSTGRPVYSAGRAMLAFRGGGRERGQLYVEGYLMAGALDPDAKVARDLALEGAAGVNVGFWERGHLTLQGGLTRTQKYFPDSFVLADYRDQKTLLLQLGVLL